ncbi:hypothetical protein FOA52_011258 [Chlamydomonas sp. UWO 241]|nr:hypothetical protein FOA52_011258 [Chlamydomonas sp. UWO 241]
MRAQVDGCIKVVASPASFTAAELAIALLNWPAVRDLTLLGVSDASVLASLSTASLAGLTSLTVRQAQQTEAWLVPMFSSAVASSLGVVDISGCVDLSSINFVRTCEQLRCLWMPYCLKVSDLSPLGASSKKLE